MKNLSLVLGFVLIAYAAQAQTEDSVKAAVNKLFTAMKNADSAMLMESFTTSAVLQSISKRKSQISVEKETIDAFASFIKTEESGALDERIIFETIKIDGDLASVWTPYRFYYKGEFSHCGVNSFQLVRINNVWKIQYLIDTRRKTGCN